MIGDDFSIDVNGNIRHTEDSAGAATYTVLEFHRWLQDLADNASSVLDDFLDITSDTPSERATDNIITLNSPYNIDDNAAEYLYDGSIQQNSGNTLYSGLVVVGSVYGTTTLQVVQDNALYDGDSPFWGTGINADAANNILCRMLIKTRTGGVDIDGKRVRVFAREWGESYAEFSVTMGLGNSVAAIFTVQDLNNQTAIGTIAGYTDITNVEGYQQIDLGNGAGNRDYYSKWDKGSRTINDVYERTKWLTRRGTSSVIHQMDGELFRGITHQWNYDNENGTYDEDETLSWGSGSTAGTACLLALDDNGTDGTMWVQLLTGVPPTDGMWIFGADSAPATCQVNGSVTSRSLSPVFFGQSTGSAIIGAFGIGVDPNDLTTNDLLFDLTNTQQQPPNNVTFTVYGLESGETRLLCTNAQAGSIDFDQMTLNTALTGASETTVDVGTGNIPADTPQTGTLRIELNSGKYRKVDYTAHDSDDEFTIPATNFSADNADATNNVFIAYIDKLAASDQESFTIVYNADRTIFVRARDGGGSPMKTYETTSPLNTGGGSATVSVIDDY